MRPLRKSDMKKWIQLRFAVFVTDALFYSAAAAVAWLVPGEEKFFILLILLFVLWLIYGWRVHLWVLHACRRIVAMYRKTR